MSDIATNLTTMANNTPSVIDVVNAAKVTASGSAVRVDDVLDAEHGLQVQLHSDSVTDFSGIEVQVYGKNLIDFVGLLGEGYTYESNGIATNIVDGCVVTTGTVPNTSGWTYGIYPNREKVMAQKIFLPAGTYSTPKKLSVQLRDEEANTNTNYQGTFTIAKPLQLVWFYTAYSNKGITVNDAIPLVIVAGSEVPTEYIPYKGTQTATADASGKVTGLVSVSPSMTLLADSADVTLECSYFPESAADTYAKYQEIKQEQTALRDKLQEYLQEE